MKAIQKKHLDVQYRIVEVMIDQGNVDLFERLETSRPINPTVVTQIHGALRSGIHFQSPIVVNDVSPAMAPKSKYRLIDGQHRMAAIKRFVREDGAAVKVMVAIYDHLNSADEAEIFSLWSRGVPENLRSFLNHRRMMIPIIDMLERDFPHRVYLYPPGTGMIGWDLVHLVTGYIARKTKYSLPGGRSGRLDIAERFSKLGREDKNALVEFDMLFTSIFGTPGRTNIYSNYKNILSCVWKVSRQRAWRSSAKEGGGFSRAMPSAEW